MKKFTPLFIILGALLLMSISILLSTKNTFSNISFSEFKEKLTSEEFAFIYLGNPDCSHCKAMESSISQVVEELEIEAYYLNTADLKEEDITYITKLHTTLEQFGTPTFIFVKYGKIIGTHIGSGVAGDEFVNIVKGYMEDTLYTKISAKQASELFNKKSTNVIVLGQTTCGYCTMFKTVLDQTIKDYGITINYLEYDLLTSEERESVTALDKKLESFGTPYTIITKNGKIVDEISGYVEEEEFVKVLKENKIIK